jgi:hypothetical protein
VRKPRGRLTQRTGVRIRANPEGRLRVTPTPIVVGYWTVKRATMPW